jgi:hypothetical protein
MVLQRYKGRNTRILTPIRLHRRFCKVNGDLCCEKRDDGKFIFTMSTSLKRIRLCTRRKMLEKNRVLYKH